MYSICYVLTDKEEMEYYNEMMISIFSLRKRNFKGTIYVLMDQKTSDIIASNNRDDFDRCQVTPVVVDVPATFSQRIKSRYIKTSIRKWIKGDYLYIDTDTVIAEELPDQISEHELALAPDVNCKFSDMSYTVRNYHMRLHARADYGEIDQNQMYYNSGVMWVKDTELTHRFYKAWHKKWYRYMKKTDVVEDQPGLNRANIEMGCVIHMLPNIYNVQVSGNPFPINHLKEAKVIHYIHNAKEGTHMLSDKKLDKSDYMAPHIQKIIEDPKVAFNPGTMMKLNEDRERILASYSYYVLKRLYFGHPKLFEKCERIIPCLLRVKEKLTS